MMSNNPFEFNTKDITSIVPEYDFTEVGEGRFRVELGYNKDAAFTIRFGAFMDHRLKEDQKQTSGDLFMFMMNNYSDKTISHAIYDLYDIGFPVNEWVVDYIKYITSQSGKYGAMINLLSTLRNFGEEDSNDFIY